MKTIQTLKTRSNIIETKSNIIETRSNIIETIPIAIGTNTDETNYPVSMKTRTPKKSTYLENNGFLPSQTLFQYSIQHS